MVSCLIGKQIVSFGRESEKVRSNDFVIITNKVQYVIKERGRPAKSFIIKETEKCYIPSYLEEAFEILSKKKDKIVGEKLYCEGEKEDSTIIPYSAKHRGQQHTFKGRSCFCMIEKTYHSATTKYKIAKRFTSKDAKRLKNSQKIRK